jgi:hypothetical protein
MNGSGLPPEYAGPSPTIEPLSPEEGRRITENQAGGSPYQNPSVGQYAGAEHVHDEAKTGDIRARVTLVTRQISNLQAVRNRWQVGDAGEALISNSMGIFDWPAQMWDSITGDDRVQATLDARVDGLLGSELMVTPSTIGKYKGSDVAKECALAWQDNLARILSESALSERRRWTIGMGWSLGTLNWDMQRAPWIPIYEFYHPRFSYYHWPLMKYVALTMDGQRAVFPGDGNWVLESAGGGVGGYRAWMRGAIRAVTEPWLMRHYAYTDWANFSEVHGNPWRIGKVPAAADPTDRSQFEQNLACVGHNTAMIVPQGVDVTNSYGVDLLEAKNTAGGDAFSGLIDRCDRSIILAMQGQNLTTEVDEGSLAAARVHAGVKQSKLKSDERIEALTTYQQIARPFALVNYGDPDIAPVTRRDITPVEDYDSNAKLFQAIGTAIDQMAKGGIRFDDPRDLIRFIRESFGLHSFPSFTIGDPVSSGMGGK